MSSTSRENPDIDLPPPGKKARKSLGKFFKKTSAMPAALQLEEAITSELNSYLLSPSIDSEDDPLKWWRLHQINFPRMSRVAQNYLCIPATSSPSERVFSTGGNVVTSPFMLKTRNGGHAGFSCKKTFKRAIYFLVLNYVSFYLLL